MSHPTRRYLAATAAVAVLLAGACERSGVLGSGEQADALPSGKAVLLAAGDVAECGNDGAEATARLLDRLSGTVLVLGDAAYPTGTAEQFQQCYEPTWGRHRGRTLPVPGNHEYYTEAGGPYYDYFGAAAGPPGLGYYSYGAGPWHVLALNSELDLSAASAQVEWLRADLAANPAPCTLAYLHRPRFSSGEHGNQDDLADLWQVLYDAGVDVVLGGHDHDYERVAPLRPDGIPDPQMGVRQFVVGTGGKGLRAFEWPIFGSEVRLASSFGILRLALEDDAYHWDFIATDGRVLDSGTGSCH